MDPNVFVPAWAPQAGQSISSAFVAGVNAAILINPIAITGGFVIGNEATTIAVRVLSATGIARIALGPVGVVAAVTDAPIIQADGWVRMTLRPENSHLAVFGVTAAGTLEIWFQGVR